MKKVVIFVLAAMLGSLLVASTAFAAGSKVNKAKAAEAYVRLQLEAALSDVANAGTGLVSIYFDINSKGGLEVLSVNGTDNNLVGDVKSALKHESFKAPKVLEGKYLVTVRFVDHENASTSSLVPATEVLRDEISEALASINSESAGSVRISFLVNDGNFLVKKVEGDAQLASAVKKTLSSNAISVPEEMSGYYQLDVRF